MQSCLKMLYEERQIEILLETIQIYADSVAGDKEKPKAEKRALELYNYLADNQEYLVSYQYRKGVHFINVYVMFWRIHMSKINVIQNAIKELEGGSFQKLFDAYLYKKYKFTNIQTLGVQEGTNKTTKGTPDSFVVDEDEKYILIMYGTVETDTFSKMKKDILSCFNTDKLQIEEEQIAKIICACSSTNIHVEQMEELRNMIPGIEIDIIGLSTISHDLLVNYPFLASEYLNISVDTQQIFTREEFIKVYDKNGMNAPLGMKFCYRDKEKEELYSAINNSNITLVTGSSGIGKTRLVLEVCKRFEDEGWDVLCVKNNGEVLYNDMKYYTSDEGKERNLSIISAPVDIL